MNETNKKKRARFTKIKCWKYDSLGNNILDLQGYYEKNLFYMKIMRLWCLIMWQL